MKSIFGIVKIVILNFKYILFINYFHCLYFIKSINYGFSIIKDIIKHIYLINLDFKLFNFTNKTMEFILFKVFLFLIMVFLFHNNFLIN
jgi:hypothetical protein